MPFERPATQWQEKLDPHVMRQNATVVSVDILPRLIFGSFRLKDGSIEVKNNRINHTVASSPGLSKGTVIMAHSREIAMPNA